MILPGFIVNLMAFTFTTGVALFYSVTIMMSACLVVQSALIPKGELSISVKIRYLQ